MSIGTFFKSVEEGAGKIATFIVKEMTAAESILGAKTGSAKANIVISAVEAALAAMGVSVGTAQAELKAVADALTALFNKIGLFTTSTTPPAA
jgi:hypothetical protein